MSVHPKDLPNMRTNATLYQGMLRRGQFRALDNLLTPFLHAGCRDAQLLGIGAAAAAGLQQTHRAIHLSRQALKFGRRAPRPWRARRHRDLGVLYSSVDRPDQALAQFQHASALGIVRDLKFLLPYGRVMLGARQYRSAARILAEALRLSPDQTEIAMLLARAFERSGLWAEACEVYQQICEKQPGDADPHLSFARALYAGGEIAAALRIVTGAQIMWSDNKGFHTLDQMIRRQVVPHAAIGPFEALYEFAMAHDLAAEPQICAQIEVALSSEHPQSQKAHLYLAAAKMAADLGRKTDSRDYERLGQAIARARLAAALAPAQVCVVTAPDRPPQKSQPVQ